MTSGGRVGQAHAEREEQQRDRDVAKHLDADVERRPQLDFEQADGKAGDGGSDDRHSPQVPQPGVVVEHPGAERVVQHVLDEEEHDGERQRPCSPKASTISGRPMLPELLNIIGGSRVRVSTFISFATGQAIRPEPSTTATPPSASDQLAIRLKSREASAREHQRRHEDVHVQLIGEGHVRLF